MDNIGKLNAAIYRNLQGIINDRLKAISIRSGQHDFFYVISLNEGITQKELCEKLYVGKSTTAKVIKHLEASGYIYKEKDSNDRRVEHLYLTIKGREISKQIHDTFQEGIAITTKGFSQEEIEQTVESLKRILVNVTSEKERINTDL